MEDVRDALLSIVDTRAAYNARCLVEDGSYDDEDMPTIALVAECADLVDEIRRVAGANLPTLSKDPVASAAILHRWVMS